MDGLKKYLAHTGYDLFERRIFMLKYKIRKYLSNKNTLSLKKLRKWSEKNKVSLKIKTGGHYTEDSFDVVDDYICQEEIPKNKSGNINYILEHQLHIKYKNWPESGLGYILKGGVLYKPWFFDQGYFIFYF